jgi:hypothetical protein
VHHATSRTGDVAGNKDFWFEVCYFWFDVFLVPALALSLRLPLRTGARGGAALIAALR